jgi:hypothetical protein
MPIVSNPNSSEKKKLGEEEVGEEAENNHVVDVVEELKVALRRAQGIDDGDDARVRPQVGRRREYEADDG